MGTVDRVVEGESELLLCKYFNMAELARFLIVFFAVGVFCHGTKVEIDDEERDTTQKSLSEWTSRGVGDVARSATHREKRRVDVCSAIPFSACSKLGMVQQLLQIGCSNSLQYFLCSMYAPVCENGVPLPPCRELCMKAYAGCYTAMPWFGLRWPDHLKCDQFPKYGTGVNCVLKSHYKEKEAEEAKRVVAQETVIDGHWGTWSAYDECKGRCGNFGMQIRRRECNNPKPKNGGKKCAGEGMQAQVCGLPNPCPVNGNWGQWGPFTDCSKTCGEGKQTRTRKCDNPKPRYGGIRCYGRPDEEKSC